MTSRNLLRSVRRRAIYPRLLEVLAEAGISENQVTVVQRGCHPCLIFPHQGRERKFFFAGTSSDYRAAHNAATDLKKILQS